MAYSQNDPAWKNVLLGFNTSREFTIGTAGCYVTAIANVCRWAGTDRTPLQINDFAKQNKWFIDGGLLKKDDVPSVICSNLKFVGRTNWSGPTPMDFFSDADDPNVAYIVLMDASPAVGVQTHYSMVWSRSGANDLMIDDSWDGVRKKLSSYGAPSKILYSAMKFVKASAPVSTPQGGTTVASNTFIDQVFQGFLGRPADQEAFSHYGSGQYSAPEFVVNDVFNSVEARNRRGALAAQASALTAAQKQAADFGASNVKLSEQVSALTQERNTAIANLKVVQEANPVEAKQAASLDTYSAGELLAAGCSKVFKFLKGVR